MADPMLREHLAGRQHLERPERFDAVLNGLKNAGLLDRTLRVDARDATGEELLLCHTAEYLETVRRDVASYLRGDVGVVEEPRVPGALEMQRGG
jgi:acetoin utilization deacetylase AcuC-like enzyme